MGGWLCGWMAGGMCRWVSGWLNRWADGGGVGRWVSERING